MGNKLTHYEKPDHPGNDQLMHCIMQPGYDQTRYQYNDKWDPGFSKSNNYPTQGPGGYDIKAWRYS